MATRTYGPGLVCPVCGSADAQVRDSRPGAGFIRRRRKCMAPVCGTRFSTAEFVIGNGAAGMPASVAAALKMQAGIEALSKHERELIYGMLAALLAKDQLLKDRAGEAS